MWAFKYTGFAFLGSIQNSFQMNENAIKDFVQRATEHKCPGEEVEHRDIQAVKRLGKISHGNIRKLLHAILDRLQASNSQVRGPRCFVRSRGWREYFVLLPSCRFGFALWSCGQRYSRDLVCFETLRVGN
jgi:hypothetical protein